MTTPPPAWLKTSGGVGMKTKAVTGRGSPKAAGPARKTEGWETVQAIIEKRQSTLRGGLAHVEALSVPDRLHNRKQPMG